MHRIILFLLLAISCLLGRFTPTAVAQFRFQRQPQYVPRYTQPRLSQPGLAPGQQYVPGRRSVGQPNGAVPAQPNTNSQSASQTGVLVPGFPAPVATVPAGSALSRTDFRNPSLELLRQLGAEKPAGMQDKAYEVYPRLSGEFEPQKAMLLSISDLMYQHYDVLKELITKTSGHLPLVILVNDKEQLKTAVEIAESTGADLSHLKLYVFKLDTIWLRDFGPRFLQTKDGAVSVDFYYDGTRPLDDQFPNHWGEVAGVKNTTVQWTLQGGNLISNGKGLAIASTRIFEENDVRFPHPRPGMNAEYESHKMVVDSFKKECNIDQFVFLKPLTPEATKHVDMLATFLSPGHMLVAKVDPRLDPVNSRTLDENAAFLQTLKVDGRPMRVDRIEIPPRQGKYWSPYTNVIFANDLVLLPIYKSDSPYLINNAVKTYQRLLPGKHVDTIDLTTMQKLEGALHCMSVNVPEYVDLPEGTLSIAQAKQVLAGTLTLKKPKRLLINRDVREGRKLDPAPPVRRRPKAAEPMMIPGEVVTGELDASAANGGSRARVAGASSRSSSRQSTSNGRASEQQMAAANTYRRTFVDDSRHFSLDAYAIGVEGDQLNLLRVADKRMVKVNVSRLCKQDQQWIGKNKASILANGSQVKKFVDANQSLAQ